MCPNPSQTRVSRAEAENFAQRRRENQALELCTPDLFRLYLDGPPKSEWNKSAARIFSRSFAQFHSLSGTLLAEINSMALSRIKTIKAEYMCSRASAEIQEAKERAQRRHARRANVSFSTFNMENTLKKQ